jgi:DNA-binding CsgD family transcriptional regulator
MKHTTQFSQREREVVTLLLQGRSNKQIALSLGITEGTVEFHLTNIYAKLGLASRAEAIIQLGQPGKSLEDFKLVRIDESAGKKHGETPVEIGAASTYDGNKRVSSSQKADAVTAERKPLTRNVLTSILFGATLALVAGVVLYLYLSTPITWKGYERECEYPDEYSVGQATRRTNADGSMVHGQLGVMSASPWSALAGYVTYESIHIPQVNNLFLMLRYSKSSPPSTPILIYLDNEPDPRATFYPTDLGNWNTFTWTEPIPLGRLESGIHAIMFYTEGQEYGVADLDKFILIPSSP